MVPTPDERKVDLDTGLRRCDEKTLSSLSGQHDREGQAYYPVMQAHPAVRVATVLVAISLAACQSTPRAPTIEPGLNLLESSELRLPTGCVASGSFVVAFTVATTGRTDAIRAPEAPGCVQDALTAWVASFRYEPPTRPTPTSMEWMVVTARRGS